MKLALIFLSTLLAITHQQYQNSMERNWFPPQPISHHFYYNYLQDPYIHQYRSSRPIPYYQIDEQQNQRTMADTDSTKEENDASNSYPVIQSRNTAGFKNPTLQDEQKPRFIYFGGASTYTNPFFRTATFTLKSTISITTVQMCAPSSVFATGATTCRRKRSDSNLWIGEPAGHEQLYIAPTETHKVEPTMQPMDLFREESSPTSNTHHGLTTSKQEINVDESELSSGNWKRKRFAFNQYVSSTTTTSYTFVTTTVTKTAFLAASTMALCRPEGYINC